MSRSQAPLYTRAHALCCFVGEFVAARSPVPGAMRAVEQGATELLCSLSLALTFPTSRRAWLSRADEEVVRLRARLALARDLRQASPGWVRAASAQVDEIGRMLGGWQRSLARDVDADRIQRRRARAAASASCAAAASGTTQTTAAPQPATGTSPTGTATTTASVSSLPPSPEPEGGRSSAPG